LRKNDLQDEQSIQQVHCAKNNAISPPAPKVTDWFARSAVTRNHKTKNRAARAQSWVAEKSVEYPVFKFCWSSQDDDQSHHSTVGRIFFAFRVIFCERRQMRENYGWLCLWPFAFVGFIITAR
jgi:hypothetical protein